jgi:branched-chain amino acid transport system ATP-binding protein
MPESNMLEVKQIDAYYGSLRVLFDISIEIKPGETVAIIGANGAGKSTLLKTITGMMHPKMGRILFEGRDITGMPPYRIVEQGISMVPEGRRIFPDMTVYENLRLGSYHSTARSKRDNNFKKIYEYFPILKDRKNQLAKTLSGGEQQMMAIGSALMSDPRLLLLDEMSLGLSPLFVNKLYRIMAEIREQGMTIIFVEQNVKRTLTEADRAYILESGAIVLSGSAEWLREEESVKKAYFGI